MDELQKTVDKRLKLILELSNEVSGLSKNQQTMFFSSLMGALIGLDKVEIIDEALNEAKKW